MKKSVFLILVFLSLIVLLIRFGFQPLISALGYKDKGGIKITTIPDGASVFIDGKEAGKTPFQNENLGVKEYHLKLENGEASWQGVVKLSKRTLVVINRELSKNIASSSGEIMSLNEGKGALITSTPNGSVVEIDGKLFGKTPLTVVDLSGGEHNFSISHDGYIKRSIRASIPANLLLHLDVDLAVSEADLSLVSAPPVSSVAKLIVRQTPTGFLRVREKPSLDGVEVARLSPGEGLTLLEEMGDWDKIKLENGVEGYVFSLYVQKQEYP